MYNYAYTKYINSVSLQARKGVFLNKLFLGLIIYDEVCLLLMVFMDMSDAILALICGTRIVAVYVIK